MRFPDYSAKPPTSEMDTNAPRKREPAPFAGNHVVDLKAVERLRKGFIASPQTASVRGSDTKRSATNEVPPVESPFADPEEDQNDDEPVF
jgi:hypothetical protein